MKKTAFILIGLLLISTSLFAEKKAIEVDLAAFTAPEILDGAKYRGYQETLQVETPVYQLDDLGGFVLTSDGSKIVIGQTSTTVPNLESPTDYLARMAKSMFDSWLAERLINEMRRQQDQSMQVISNQIKDKIALSTKIINSTTTAE